MEEANERKCTRYQELVEEWRGNNEFVSRVALGSSFGFFSSVGASSVFLVPWLFLDIKHSFPFVGLANGKTQGPRQQRWFTVYLHTG